MKKESELSKPEGEPVMKEKCCGRCDGVNDVCIADKDEVKLAEEKANKLYPNYPHNPNVSRKNRACVVAFMDGFRYANQSKPESVIGERSAEEFAVKQKFLNDFLNGKTVHDLFEEYIAPQFKPKSSTLQEWVSVKERLPESNVWVLCVTKTGPSFVGKYTKGHEIEYWDDDYDGTYDEIEDKNGTLYLKPGWYELEEQNHHEYDEMWMSRIVTHWQPLPSPPKQES